MTSDLYRLEKSLSDTLAVEGTPNPATGDVNSADTAIIELTPEEGKYVNLIQVESSVNNDGDSVEIQALDTGGNWRTITNIDQIANAGMVRGYPNMTLDKITVGGTEYEIQKGDGSTATVRAISRGGGSLWKATLIYYEE